MSQPEGLGCAGVHSDHARGGRSDGGVTSLAGEEKLKTPQPNLHTRSTYLVHTYVIIYEYIYMHTYIHVNIQQT